MEIKTSRLRLRIIKKEDAARIVELRNQENIYQFFKDPHKLTIEEHLQWYEKTYMSDESSGRTRYTQRAYRNKCAPHDRTRYDFVIICLENDEVIGTCGITKLDVENRSMEISYLLHQNYQKKGYAAEAVRALLDMAVQRWHIRDVYAQIHQENSSSISFIEKLGFEKHCQEENFFIYRQIIKGYEDDKF